MSDAKIALMLLSELHRTLEDKMNNQELINSIFTTISNLTTELVRTQQVLTNLQQKMRKTAKEKHDTMQLTMKSVQFQPEIIQRVQQFIDENHQYKKVRDNKNDIETIIEINTVQDPEKAGDNKNDIEAIIEINTVHNKKHLVSRDDVSNCKSHDLCGDGSGPAQVLHTFCESHELDLKDSLSEITDEKASTVTPSCEEEFGFQFDATAREKEFAHVQLLLNSPRTASHEDLTKFTTTIETIAGFAFEHRNRDMSAKDDRLVRFLYIQAHEAKTSGDLVTYYIRMKGVINVFSKYTEITKVTSNDKRTFRCDPETSLKSPTFVPE